MDQKEPRSKANGAPNGQFIRHVFLDLRRPKLWDAVAVHCESGFRKTRRPLDLDRISGLLRGLRPQQEKVIRLYFGLGCQRPHSAQELAEEFGVSAQVIAGILGAAQRRLAQDGLTSSQLREAARLKTEPRPPNALRSSSEPMSRVGRNGRCHHHRS